MAMKIPDPETIDRELERNAVEAKLLRQQYAAAKRIQEIESKAGETVEAQHCLPVGMTADGLTIVAVVPPETSKYDRQRLLDAKHAKDFELIMQICSEIGGQVSTAKLLPEAGK